MDDKLKDISEKLGKLLDIHPMNFDDPQKISIPMRESLARMYGDTNLRGFFENAIRLQNQNLLRATEREHMLVYKAKIEILMQVLAMGKENFIHFEMVNRKKGVPVPEKINK